MNTSTKRIYTSEEKLIYLNKHIKQLEGFNHQEKSDLLKLVLKMIFTGSPSTLSTTDNPNETYPIIPNDNSSNMLLNIGRALRTYEDHSKF